MANHPGIDLKKLGLNSPPTKLPAAAAVPDPPPITYLPLVGVDQKILLGRRQKIASLTS